ncbi:MAG: YbjN domain-containing protein, partial [Chlorobi bacterium]|nr:YbjN domain-containing protein [Chlorobiota bacterium]
NMYKALLQKNQDILHGAFVLSQDGKNVIFRDTLQVENLDLNELTGSLNSLSLLMREYADKIIEFSA